MRTRTQKPQTDEPLLDAARDEGAVLELREDAPDAFERERATLLLHVEEGGLGELVILPHLRPKSLFSTLIATKVPYWKPRKMLQMSSTVSKPK